MVSALERNQLFNTDRNANAINHNNNGVEGICKRIIISLWLLFFFVRCWCVDGGRDIHMITDRILFSIFHFRQLYGPYKN